MKFHMLVFLALSFTTMVQSKDVNPKVRSQRLVNPKTQELREQIWYGMLHVPPDTPNANSLEKIWQRGGYRNRIRQIISKSTLTTQDFNDLVVQIKNEMKIVDSKIKEIANWYNHNIRQKVENRLPILSRREREKIISDSRMSAEKAIKEEKATYNNLINKIESHLTK